MKPKEWSDIKDLVNKSYPISKIENLTGRTWSTIAMISNSDSFDDYKARITARNDKSKAKRQVQMHTNGVHLQPDNITAAPQLTRAEKLDQALELLDRSFSQLKEDMALVIKLAVDEKLNSYKAEKEAEIASLQTVVDAAKSQNLVETIKHSLMGN